MMLKGSNYSTPSGDLYNLTWRFARSRLLLACRDVLPSQSPKAYLRKETSVARAYWCAQHAGRLAPVSETYSDSGCRGHERNENTGLGLASVLHLNTWISFVNLAGQSK